MRTLFSAFLCFSIAGAALAAPRATNVEPGYGGYLVQVNADVGTTHTLIAVDDTGTTHTGPGFYADDTRLQIAISGLGNQATTHTLYIAAHGRLYSAGQHQTLERVGRLFSSIKAREHFVEAITQESFPSGGGPWTRQEVMQRLLDAESSATDALLADRPAAAELRELRRRNRREEQLRALINQIQ